MTGPPLFFMRDTGRILGAHVAGYTGQSPSIALSEGTAPVALTPPSLFTLDYFPPPPELLPFATVFYHFRCDERDIRDVQPAAVGHVMVFLAGSGEMHFATGRSERSHRVSLMTPCSAAAPITVAGPFHCIGAALSPLGWAALTGLHAGQWADRMLSAAQALGTEAEVLGEELVAAYRNGVSGADLCGRLGQFLAARLKPVNSRHIVLMKAVADWLSAGFDPPLSALFARSAYSPRQTQRLVERYFGLPPRELRRKYRALRIVALLAEPDVTDQQVAELIDHFYDQSHMIREIRHFVGRTPGRLADERDSILSALLDVRNFREIAPRIARLPGSYGANDSQ